MMIFFTLLKIAQCISCTFALYIDYLCVWCSLLASFFAHPCGFIPTCLFNLSWCTIQDFPLVSSWILKFTSPYLSITIYGPTKVGCSLGHTPISCVSLIIHTKSPTLKLLKLTLVSYLPFLVSAALCRWPLATRWAFCNLIRKYLLFLMKQLLHTCMLEQSLMKWNVVLVAHTLYILIKGEIWNS